MKTVVTAAALAAIATAVALTIAASAAVVDQPLNERVGYAQKNIAELSLQQHDRSMLTLLDRLDDSTSELSEEVDELRKDVEKLRPSIQEIMMHLEQMERDMDTLFDKIQRQIIDNQKNVERKIKELDR